MNKRHGLCVHIPTDFHPACGLRLDALDAATGLFLKRRQIRV
jgi:hypothetical protein